MHLRNIVNKPTVLLLAVLFAALLVCEAMRIRTGDAAYQAHLARWNCLGQSNRTMPPCVSLAKQGPRDDADFCGEAVAHCKATGTYDAATQADARNGFWWTLAIRVRVASIAALVGSLAWAGIVQPIRRRRRAAQA